MEPIRQLCPTCHCLLEFEEHKEGCTYETPMLQVTNEIRLAFLFAVWSKSLSKGTAERYLLIAFEATEIDELLAWLTIHEKVRFAEKLLELTGGEVYERESHAMNPEQALRALKRQLPELPRNLDSDLTEDR